MLPIIALFKQEFLISALLVPISILLFFFDNTFRKFRAKYPDFEKYNYVSFVSGLALASISFLLPEWQLLLSITWIAVVGFKGFKFC